MDAAWIGRKTAACMKGRRAEGNFGHRPMALLNRAAEHDKKIATPHVPLKPRGQTYHIAGRPILRLCSTAKLAANRPLRGLVSRVSPVQTALRNCTRDEGRSFKVGNQVLISSHRKLLLSKAMVVNVAETSGLDSDRQGLREASASKPLQKCRNGLAPVWWTVEVLGSGYLV